MEGFPQNSRETAQIVGGQNLGSMHVKDQTLEKTRTLPFRDKSVSFEDFLLICTVFPRFGPFWGGGGGEPILQTRILGGHFGPKKIFRGPPPPPEIPQLATDTLPGPRPLPSWRTPTPPPGIFNKKPIPPPCASASRGPLPPPRAGKNKKYLKRPPRILRTPRLF